MKTKKLLGKDNLLLSSEGYIMRVTDTGKKIKLATDKNGNTSYRGKQYNVKLLVWNTFSGKQVKEGETVQLIEGRRSFKIENLYVRGIAKKEPDLEIGCKFKNNWAVIDKKYLEDKSLPIYTLECPCGEYQGERTYTNSIRTKRISCPCNPKTKKVTSKIQQGIIEDKELGCSVKYICNKYQITDTTFYNVVHDKFNYSKKT